MVSEPPSSSNLSIDLIGHAIAVTASSDRDEGYVMVLFCREIDDYCKQKSKARLVCFVHVVY